MNAFLVIVFIAATPASVALAFTQSATITPAELEFRNEAIIDTLAQMNAKSATQILSTPRRRPSLTHGRDIHSTFCISCLRAGTKR